VTGIFAGFILQIVRAWGRSWSLARYVIRTTRFAFTAVELTYAITRSARVTGIYAGFILQIVRAWVRSWWDAVFIGITYFVCLAVASALAIRRRDIVARIHVTLSINRVWTFAAARGGIEFLLRLSAGIFDPVSALTAAILNHPVRPATIAGVFLVSSRSVRTLIATPSHGIGYAAI